MLTFDKWSNILFLVECRGETDEQNTDRFIAGDAGPAGAQNAERPADARLRHCPPETSKDLKQDYATAWIRVGQ